jgi:hypothetical protein
MKNIFLEMLYVSNECTLNFTNCSACNPVGNYFSKADTINTCNLKTNSPAGYFFDSGTDKHEKCNVSCLIVLLLHLIA